MPDNGSRGEPSHPMITFAADIGAIKKGVENLEKGQEEVDQKVSGLHQTVADLVTKEDCAGHREALTVAEESEAAGSLIDRVGKKAGAILAILALLGTLGGVLLVLSRFIGSVERTLEKDRAEQKQVTQKMLKRLDKPQRPVIVHQPVYIYPDAGPRRRPRRRPRRLPASRPTR